MQEHGNLGTVGRVRMDTELDAIANLLIDLVVVDVLLGKLGKRHEALLEQVLQDESCFAGESHERCSVANPQSRQRA